MNGYFADYTKRTGVPIADDFHSDTSNFWAGMQAGHAPWSIINFAGGADAVKSQRLGQLAPLDTNVIPVDKLNPGAHSKYFLKSFAWATILVWNKKKWPSSGPQPKTVSDFFNTAKFPGKRCLYKSPNAGGVLEAAEVAAGVPSGKIYPIQTNKAFKELDKIKSSTVWYSSGDDAVRYLSNGNCDLGITWNGRVYQAITKNHAPLSVSWSFAVYDPEYWAIPKNAPNPRAAQAALAMLVYDRDAAKKFATSSGYAMDLKKPLALPSTVSSLLAVSPNTKNAIVEDDQWYGTHTDQLTKEFDSWLVGG